jgi:hypothetical protein
VQANVRVPFVDPSPLSILAFLCVVAFVLVALLNGVYSASQASQGAALKRTLLVGGATAVWLTLLSLVVASGAIAASPVPRLLLFLIASNLAGLLLAASPVGRWVATGVPIWALVGFQGFRLPLELVLHSWAEQGTIPTTMTWNGSNLDIITGIIAVLSAWLIRTLGGHDGRSRAAAWLVNIVGFALLVNVGRVAVLSSPLPFAWGVSPPLQLAFFMPYALIVPVCVAGALAGHIVLTRALLTGAGSAHAAGVART